MEEKEEWKESVRDMGAENSLFNSSPGRWDAGWDVEQAFCCRKKSTFDKWNILRHRAADRQVGEQKDRWAEG